MDFFKVDLMMLYEPVALISALIAASTLLLSNGNPSMPHLDPELHARLLFALQRSDQKLTTRTNIKVDHSQKNDP